ncbi:hypothetical protein ST47_g9806 [Ascochyta rabiei]|uniref:BTB domain-containing protein n=1 Tax=Didymella rabiei TaxID=5454 RepID=A0A162WJ58_DIDRA|nr:hypothetical protein ST47_g9806 [Ascochyta rabiei]
MASQGTLAVLPNVLMPPTSVTLAVQTTPAIRPTPPTPPTTNFRLLDPLQLSVCQGPSTTPPSSCYNLKDVATILVKDGLKRKEYTVLRELVMWHSSYFAAALNPEGGWSQDGEQPLTLDCAHATFDATCCWLFTGKLNDPATDNMLIDKAYLSQRTLVSTWTFADFHGIPALGNSAIDMMHERSVAVWVLPCYVIRHVYEYTTAASKLRKYFVERYILSCPLDLMTAEPSLYTKEFLCAVLPALARDERCLDRDSLTSVDRCQWHDHSGPGGKLRLDSRKCVSL